MEKPYLERIQNSVDYIEDHLLEKISIQNIARKAAMSPWHFQRMFRSISGDSVKTYLRKRRLNYAAMQLKKHPHIRLLDLALQCQFESQQSFTRAFKKQFLKTPKKFAQIDEDYLDKKKFRINIEYLKHLKGKLNMKPEIKNQTEKKLIGIGVQFTGVFADGGKEDKTISKLWTRFKSRIDEIPNQIGNVCYGIVDCYPTDTQSQSDENLVYFACVEVENFNQIPKGMRPFIIPECQLAIFKHEAAPNDIDHTLKYIYGTWLPETKYEKVDGPDIEIISRDFSKDSSIHYGIMIQ